MSVALTPAESVDIRGLGGPLLVGYIINWGLFGVLSVQVYLYYLGFPNDRNTIKSLIAVVYIIEMLQSILVAHDAFAIFVTGFGNFEVLEGMHFAWLTVCVLYSLLSSIVQVVYALRISVIARTKVPGILISLLAVTQAAGGILAGVEGFKIGSLAKRSKPEVIGHGISVSGSFICDIIIAGCMVYYLSRLKTGYKSTRARISRVISLTIETGALTAAAAIVEVVLFFRVSQTGYFLTPAFVLGKLYSNSMMMLFNSRLHIASGRNDTLESHDRAVSSNVFNNFRFTTEAFPPSTEDSAEKGLTPISTRIS